MIPAVIPDVLRMFRLMRVREALAEAQRGPVSRETRQALVDGSRDLDAEIALEHRAWRLTHERTAMRNAADDAYLGDIALLFSGSAVTEMES